MSDKKKKSSNQLVEGDAPPAVKRTKSNTSSHSRESSKDDKIDANSEPTKRRTKEKKHKKSSSKAGESEDCPPSRTSGIEESDPSPQVDPDPPAKKALKGTPSPKSSPAVLARGENDTSDDDIDQFFTPTATPPLSADHARIMTADEEEELARLRQQRMHDGRRRGAFYAGDTKSEKKIGADPMAPVEEAPNSSSGLASADVITWTGAKQANKLQSKSKRLHCGFAETVGRRPTMEDDFVFVGQFRGDPFMDLVGLFDGHRGSSAAKFAARELSTVLTQTLKTAKPREALKQAFIEMHSQMKQDSIQSGATALAALFTKNKVFIANAGDSRAVLCRGDKAIRLTTDHRPDTPEEIERITKLGGDITTVVTKDGKVISRVEGLLGVSRALGDFDLEPYVTAEPELSEFVIHSEEDGPSKENQFLVLACDGLWEMVSDQEAVDLASFFVTNRSAEAAAKRLRDVAYARGSTDNISVSVIKLPSREEDQSMEEASSAPASASNDSNSSSSSKRGNCVIV